jgi:polysaccharide deacetylase family protein (PEP-CTERM system associated)
VNVLTFDIEEWWAYERDQRGNREDYLPRLDRYLNEVLELLDEKSIKATFFCLGAMAEQFPDPIVRIAERGHHIGCHSYSHKFFANATYEEVEEDTRRAVSVLEDLVGHKVTAYRAPAFSLTEKNAWMIEILVSLGIECDSSVFPARRSYGGIGGFATKAPCVLNYKGTVLKEFPISTASVCGRDLAYSGGGYFRMLPYPLIRNIAANEQYVITYFHIMDFDKEQQRRFRSFEGENAFARYFKNYYGLSGAFNKFTRFVNDFDFVSVEEAAGNVDWGNVPVVDLSETCEL